jgi:hypothetical protein
MDNSKKCGNCVFWEHRPEMAMDVNTGFCAMKDAFMNKKSFCKRYQKKGTSQLSNVLDPSLLMPNEEDDFETYDA